MTAHHLPFQPQLERRSPPVVTPLRPLLMALAPARSVQGVLRLRQGSPDQAVEQAAHFRHSYGK